jgi:hypothetical protein
MATKKHELSDSDFPAVTRVSFCENTLRILVLTVSGNHPTWPGALNDDSVERIEEHVEAILEEIRAGFPAEMATAAIIKRFARP